MQRNEKILKLNTKIINKQNPEWGIRRIIKIPTTDQDWYEVRGDSGEHVLDKWEANTFWEVVP